MKNILNNMMENNFVYFISNVFESKVNKNVDVKLNIEKNGLNLPLPACEKMNALVSLYLDVCFISLFIFFIVSYVLLETIGVYSSSVRSINSKEYYSYSSLFPIHYTSEEEHFIDIFVILVPTAIILEIIVPTLGYLYNEEMLYYDTAVSFEVNIIGNQWFWSYEYIIDVNSSMDTSSWNTLSDNSTKEPLCFNFDSVIKGDNPKNRLLDVDQPLILPVNTNVLLSFTSRDVIHSWALPQMGIKVDCIPGRITNTIFSSYALGVFYGQCSELCGPLHGFMVRLCAFY